MIFRDRTRAGRALAERVAEAVGECGHRPIVLALPRGGLPVAAPVADRLGADLDIVVARKLGAPGRPEWGLGAIAEDGPPVYDQDNLRYAGLTERDLSGTLDAERLELRRRVRRYRGDRPAPAITGRVVVLVDDGLATGVTAHAALRWINGRNPERVLLAVPVCSPEARDLLAPETDGVVCLSAPPDFCAVGRWYEDFGQLTDEDVDEVLRRYAHA
ncbi:phosphoribosyltransferase [Actinoplanes teichomyceticus]|uniref:Putative phosphoribosyltransferase n=1 Tax=Actinoplanes teichomyceticus TaxID=1867 RepID=A0A561WA77_ACTTI|nr:phosphoribosyltransferase family protein [Actinoplanes teichomyceticus]TWG20767.1 putative phosphoribosyltransferase [Actinoplanes teichomyceticus]GIF14423.1 phosphoribosyltransferase [Actinoplanes teichomyceticus]